YESACRSNLRCGYASRDAVVESDGGRKSICYTFVQLGRRMLSETDVPTSVKTVQNEPAYRGVPAFCGRSDAICLVDGTADQHRCAHAGRANRSPREHPIEALKRAQSRRQPFFQRQRSQQNIQYVARDSTALVFGLSANFLGFLNRAAD